MRKSAIRYSNKAKSPASPEEASCINTIDLSIRTTAWYGPCIDSQQLWRQTNKALTPRGQVVAKRPAHGPAPYLVTTATRAVNLRSAVSGQALVKDNGE